MAAQSGLGFSGIVAIQIPDDGAIGEVLTKITADNYDYDWLPGGGGGGGQVNSVVGGVNINVNAADPVNPIVNLDAVIVGVSVNGVILNAVGLATNFLNEAGAYVAVPPSGGQVDSVVGGANVNVNAADPVNPIVNLDAAILGVSVNGVTLNAVGLATNFLNETGVYSVPPLDTVAADALYLRLDTANDPLTGNLSTLSVVPTTDQGAGVTFGSDSLRPLSVRGRLGVFVGSSLNNGVPSSAPGARTFGSNPTGIMAGNQGEGGAGTSIHYLLGGSFKGVACIGNAAAGATGNALLSNRSGGSSLFGSAYTYGAGNATVEATSFGNFTTAYAYCTGNNHLFSNRGAGGFLAGYSQGPGLVTAEVTGAGAFCVVRPISGAGAGSVLARAAGAGSFAQGSPVTSGGGLAISQIIASGAGSFAQGRPTQSGAGTSTIQATGAGSFAQGQAAISSAIEALAAGAFAQGQALGNNITASGIGAFAHGDSTAGAIVASAANATQFGPGTNALADTFQIGNAGIRFSGTAGAPAAPQNGDFWVNGVFVYVRSNGVSIQIAGPGPLTS